ncbi:MAG: Uncharacterized protein CEN90_274 [Parcubacteria group bacterium Licking1014_17]|nr:MAG: Uncharacterized protein CEN90_274 [Parcubacteria group bacterium Licking1014_17]
MKEIVTIAQIVLSAVVIGLILVQRRGAGLSATFGGSGATYSTRRGAEKVIFILTIIASAILFIVSIARVYIEKTLT